MAFADEARLLFAHAGLTGAGDVWDGLRQHSPARRVSAELAAKRRMGREAYERSAAARGVPAGVYASVHWLWEDDE